MSRLDRFAAALHAASAECVILKSGKRVEIRTNGKGRPLTRAPVGAKTLVECLREIAPTQLLDEVGQDGESRFLYESPTGRVVVTTRLRGDELEVELRAAATTEAGPDTVEMDALLTKVVQEKCSDLHLSSLNPPLFRKDGAIVEIG
jgi:Tfp pilus assembly pilus retraction ATPase PilT